MQWMKWNGSEWTRCGQPKRLVDGKVTVSHGHGGPTLSFRSVNESNEKLNPAAIVICPESEVRKVERAHVRWSRKMFASIMWAYAVSL